MTQRLDLLEKRGLLSKRVLSTMPPRTEYRLTGRGAALRPVMEAIEAWAAR
jgi:DNA-binding HxlR family transcriptional regulator